MTEINEKNGSPDLLKPVLTQFMSVLLFFYTNYQN